MTRSASYMPGLTGLRGIAVVAVVAYHLGLISGGFLGVDVFFVLSGFLITRLLLGSEPSVPSGLLQWWMKRYRRLTPAVAVVVIAVLIAFMTRTGVVLNSIATLTWWQNWHLIIEGKPYWATSPSALRHAWSLSIEEQFYALWPLTLLTTVAVSRRLRVRRPPVVVAIVSATLAIASFCWAAALAIGGSASLSRIYYGTDTRMGGLLTGCAVAAILTMDPDWKVRRPLTLAVVPAGLGMVVLFLTLSPESPVTYTGGLITATALSTVLVLASSAPGPFASALEWAPLQWLGIHSYAIYLWSWPIQVFAETHLPNAPRITIVAITVPCALVLSAVSLRLVEEPLRRAASWARNVGPRRAAWLGGYAAIIVLMIIAASSTRLTATEQVAQEFERLPDPVTTTTTICVPSQTPSTLPPEFSGDTDRFDDSTITDLADPTRDPCADGTVTVMVVGDSTGRGAANGLRRIQNPALEVWDRTDLGCGLRAPSDKCPDWHTAWATYLAEIGPDVVVVYTRAIDDLIPGEDPPYTSQEAQRLRSTEFDRANSILGATGAKVLWVLPAHMEPNAAFYCEGSMVDTPCDPAWIDMWRADVITAAERADTAVLDAGAWVESRPPENAAIDRPDGLHLSGPALDDHAIWLEEHVFALTRPND